MVAKLLFATVYNVITKSTLSVLLSAILVALILLNIDMSTISKNYRCCEDLNETLTEVTYNITYWNGEFMSLPSDISPNTATFTVYKIGRAVTMQLNGPNTYTNNVSMCGFYTDVIHSDLMPAMSANDTSPFPESFTQGLVDYMYVYTEDSATVGRIRVQFIECNTIIINPSLSITYMTP